MKSEPLDIGVKNPLNDCLVSSNNNKVVILNPKTSFTKEEALLFAAWLVVMADSTEPSDTRGYTFQDYIYAVKNT